MNGWNKTNNWTRFDRGNGKDMAPGRVEESEC